MIVSGSTLRLAFRNGTKMQNKKKWEGSEAAAEYRRDFKRSHYAKIQLQLDKDKDAEIIQWIKKQPNMTAYIRNLVQADMNRNI